MISKTIGYNGVHNIFRQTQMPRGAKGFFGEEMPKMSRTSTNLLGATPRMMGFRRIMEIWPSITRLSLEWDSIDLLGFLIIPWSEWYLQWMYKNIRSM